METLTFNLGGAAVRYDTLEGQACVIADAVMITEGVWNGSQGPIYYGGEELAADPAKWDHFPIVLNHPDVNGKPVSARSRDVLDSRKMGVLLNTRYDSGKLKTEAWFFKDRANKIDARVIDNLECGNKVEVSTGLFRSPNSDAGVWNGKEYTSRAVGIRPDHLAVLPDSAGACSVKDGAGLLANELSLGDRLRAVRDALYDKFAKPGYYWDGYVCEVYSDFAVYEMGNKLHRIGYSVSDKEVVSLTGDPAEVFKVVQYRTATGALVGNASGVFVSNLEAAMKTKKEKVDALIANAESGWKEEDRKGLSDMSDASLDRLLKDAEPKSKVDPPPVAPPVGNQTTPAAAPVIPFNEYVAKHADPATQAMLSEMMAVTNEAKGKLISTITANKANVYTAEQLASMTPAQLRPIAALAAQTQPAAALPSYLGQAVLPPVANAGAVEPLALPKLTYDVK